MSTCVKEAEDMTRSPVLEENCRHEIVTKTPAAAESPLCLSTCHKMFAAPKNLRHVHKDNCYLRKSNWQLKGQLKCDCWWVFWAFKFVECPFGLFCLCPDWFSLVLIC